MEMKNVIAREGRDAKNLLLYHLSSEDELSQKTNVKKPPTCTKSAVTHRKSSSSKKSNPRVRSASTGRDKRSELQARYWALLFGNLQRAVNEIYQTVECYENLASCQEAILVLENYTRDFRALAEWFRVSWDYEATPQPQRPQSLAWEVRKSNPAPRIRSKSLSSPSPNVSGKTSPSLNYSGKSSPCSSTIEDGKSMLSPRKKLLDIKATVALTSKPTASDSSRSARSPRLALREFLLPKTDSETHANTENGVSPIDGELTKIPEENQQHITWGDLVEQDECQIEKFDSAEAAETNHDVITFDQYSQTSGFEDEYLTLQQWRDKYENGGNKPIVNGEDQTPIEAAVAHTVNKLDEMENLFLTKNANQPSELIETSVALSNENEMNMNKENATVQKVAEEAENPEKKSIQPDEKKAQTGTATPLKYSNVVNRSIVAAKPISSQKPILRTQPFKTPTVSTRSATTTVINPNAAKKLPAKTATVLPASKPKVVAHKNPSPNNRDANRRVPSANLRSNGVPSNIATRLAARSKTMIDLNHEKQQNNANRSNIHKSTSRDSFASSTSTLRASNEQISNSVSSSQTMLNTRRSEPKQLPTRGEDNDGWLTVKARRRSSLHWANRFDQPSGYASLPTLALLNEKETPNGPAKSANNKKENKKIPKPAASKSVKSETAKPNSAPLSTQHPKNGINKTVTTASTKNQTTDSKAPSKPLPAPAKPKSQKPSESTASSFVSRATILQRQKSDITGLKLTTLHKEYLRKEKSKILKESKIVDEESTKQSSTDNKVSMNIQTNMGLTSATIRDLYATISNGDGMKRDKDEVDDKEEIESDENQRKLVEEQECLERQIFELQNTEIEIDTETDDADCETILDLEESDSNVELDNCDDNNESLEAKYQYLLSDMSSGERIETLATLQAIVSRYPGRAQQLHQKLSSPSRRRSLHETLKKYQVKQSRAQDMRESLTKEKQLKLQALLARVEDVKSAKQQLIDEKRLRMEEKLQRYAENRNQYLKDKVRKAHDEEEKLKEIAFIKSLEAQNKRLDFMEMRKEQEGRLQEMEQERQKRLEEKAAKEAAVERRRLELAKERQKRLEKMDETRRKREQRVEQKQEEKEKMRQKMAREKARDREERLLALHAAQQQTTEELQRKIIQKQQESARRHEENIEHIRQRALELTIPSRNVEDGSATRNESDRRTSAEDDLSSVVSDVSIEQTKASKKKLKKLRQRLATLAEEYMQTLDTVAPYMKRDSSVPKILAMMRRGGGPQGMERPLGQLARIVAKPEVFDFQCLWLMDGLSVLADIIKKAIEPNSELSRKALIMAVQIYRDSCSPCIQIARHAVLGNSISTLFDALLYSLQTPDDKTPSHPIELSTELMLACTVVLSPFNTLKQPHPKVLERLPDIISYAVSIGLIDVLSRRCMKIREPIEIHQSVVLSVLACLGLLTKFADICPKDSNSSKFFGVIKSTELFGAISLLYATIVPVGECIPPRTISIAAATFNLILTLANLDLATFQSVLSQESLSLQFLDVVTILLKYCGPKSNEKGETQAVIVDLIATLGFFCANNEKNQNLLISDQSSVMIKSLSKLPKTFDIVVYPTLLTIISNNDGAKAVIGRDFDLKCIEEYQNSEPGKKNKMLTMLQSSPTKTEQTEK